MKQTNVNLAPRPAEKLTMHGIFAQLAAKNAQVVQEKSKRWSFDFSKGVPFEQKSSHQKQCQWTLMDKSVGICSESR